jgi:predicted transcriptional regulator
MKEHMSITVEESTARRLRRYALRERRPVSTVVEMAIEQLLGEKAPATDLLVTSRGSFRGTFSREETYEGR